MISAVRGGWGITWNCSSRIDIHPIYLHLDLEAKGPGAGLQRQSRGPLGPPFSRCPGETVAKGPPRRASKAEMGVEACATQARHPLGYLENRTGSAGLHGFWKQNLESHNFRVIHCQVFKVLEPFCQRQTSEGPQNHLAHPHLTQTCGSLCSSN